MAGGLAATGIGGLAGQILIGAGTSAISSGYSNYVDYKAGEKTLGEAVTSTLVDTGMGMLFGAVGYDGSAALNTSTKLTKQMGKALNTLFDDVIHPAVNSIAKKTLYTTAKYFGKLTISEAVSGVLSQAISLGTNKVAVQMYRNCSS